MEKTNVQSEEAFLIQSGWGGLTSNPAPIRDSHEPKNITLSTYQVTPADIEYFENNGYFVAPKLLADEDIAILREEFCRVYEGKVDTEASPYEYKYWYQNVMAHRVKSKSVKKINNGWWINKTIRSVVLSPVIGQIGATLLKTPATRLWHDQVITKPGLGPDCKGDLSGNIGWHQDYGFWQCSDTSSMVTAWIALQDTDENNGTLMTIVGSNKWGLVPDSAKFFDKDLSELETKFKTYGEWKIEPARLKAGQVVFHHALTFHGSGPNKTLEDRFALAIHMQSANCGYRSGYGNHHNVKDLGPDAKTGDLFVGPAFPLLWKEPEK